MIKCIKKTECQCTKIHLWIEWWSWQCSRVTQINLRERNKEAKENKVKREKEGRRIQTPIRNHGYRLGTRAHKFRPTISKFTHRWQISTVENLGNRKCYLTGRCVWTTKWCYHAAVAAASWVGSWLAAPQTRWRLNTAASWHTTQHNTTLASQTLNVSHWLQCQSCKQSIDDGWINQLINHSIIYKATL